jgi:hypothetical protein
MKTNLTSSYLAVLIFIFFSACIKDTDLKQADEIAVSPVIELDLIHFDLPANSFYDTIASNPILTLRDTTLLRFLNDQEVGAYLKRAEFFFKFTNAIQRDFQVEFQFLNEQNDTTYTSQNFVNQGIVSNPVVTEYIENVDGASLEQLILANKVVVSVTIPSSNANLEGNIKLQSKATYYLEF